ncbi:hypothetical protein PLESTB_000002900 [Pleodorina starrii]|uniref:Transmembrane protein 208 n=1 Tax=Pleodorina starrii TaxID=330485 RepID=A0A9W6B8X6_9CHLO|nr:hypothetical protein PLESTM_000351400 [Pleodorina starrii]GLC47575.1 hypothetical protein PLESTB_000002900 [Pleodorina starrii]GLC76860.1 hypothetical protein PLESTF_001848900 [Pleodorina starrii]
MANQGAKKRLEENRKKLQTLRLAIAIGLAFYLVVRLILRRGYESWWHIIGFVATFFLEAFSFSAISKFAEPEFSDKGEVVYGGADLSMGGMCAYWHDLLYISIFVQVASCLSAYFWYTLLVVPGFALYLLYKNVLQPYWAQSREQPVLDEATRKRLERSQQRAERRRMKWR